MTAACQHCGAAGRAARGFRSREGICGRCGARMFAKWTPSAKGSVVCADRDAAYMIHRCRSCKVQVQWAQRDRLSYGWYHGYPGEGCKYGQYLDPEHVERIEVVPK